MILVLTGTHEQPFDRLLRVLPELAKTEDVVAQVAAGTATAPRLLILSHLSPRDLRDHLGRARVVVCHAGPATVFEAIDAGHVPIVVPRSARHHEHVDDHQVQFVRRLVDQVHVVWEPAHLPEALRGHEQRCRDLRPPKENRERTERFCASIDKLCADLARNRPTMHPRRDTLSVFFRWVTHSR